MIHLSMLWYLPTWLLMKLIAFVGFPENHVWHKKQPTLRDWSVNGSPLLQMFNFVFWFIAAEILVVAWLWFR